MRDASDCPRRDLLHQLLLGRLPEKDAAPVEDHVRHCPRCGETLASLPGSDDLVDAVRRAGDADVTEMQQRAANYVAWYKRLGRGGDPNATVPPTPPNLHETLLPATRSYTPRFDFLSPPTGPDELGQLGPYVVRETLGAGGMGMVFLAYDPRLDREIALKVIRPEMVDSSDVRTRFVAEARAVAAVKHDNIVAIYEVDERNGIPYIAMPLLLGESLEERARRAGGPLPIDEVLRIGREMASGLAAAHSRGLIHRDIKPANAFLASDEGDRVKILDFGLAQALSGPNDHNPDEGRLVGTPAYMAPEQAECKAVDARADLFSLGCVMYRLAAGRPPFAGKDVQTLLMQVISEEPTPVRELNAEVPLEVAQLIASLMQKKADDRPDSATAVVEAIAEIERRRNAPKSRRWRWLTAVAAAVVAAVALTTCLMRPTPAEVTFAFDDPEHQKIVIQRGDDEPEPIDLAKSRTYSLKAGTYAVSPAVKTDKTFDPPTFNVEAGKNRTVELKLVGPPTGEVTFALDGSLEDDEILIQYGNEEPRKIEPDKKHTYVLRPGPHSLRLIRRPRQSEFPPREITLLPGDVNVEAGEKLDVKLHLVGEMRREKNHSGPVRDVACAGKGKGLLVLSADRESAVGSWKVNVDERSHLIETPEEVRHKGEIFAVALTPDGKRAASGGGGKARRFDPVIRVWDVAAGMVVKLLKGHGENVKALALTDDGVNVLSGDDSGAILFWDVAAVPPQPRSFDRGHDGEGVRAVALSADGTLAVSGGGDKKVILWDVAKGEGSNYHEDHPGEVRTVALSPDKTLVASGGADGKILLWDLTTNKRTTLGGHEKGVFRVAFSPDSKRLLSGGADEMVRLWDVAAGKEIPPAMKGHRGAVTSVAFAEDGRRATSGGVDGTIRLWELPR